MQKTTRKGRGNINRREKNLVQMQELWLCIHCNMALNWSLIRHNNNCFAVFYIVSIQLQLIYKRLNWKKTSMPIWTLDFPFNNSNLRHSAVTVLKRIWLFHDVQLPLKSTKKYYINICHSFSRHEGYEKLLKIVKTYFKIIGFWQAQFTQHFTDQVPVSFA